MAIAKKKHINQSQSISLVTNTHAMYIQKLIIRHSTIRCCSITDGPYCFVGNLKTLFRVLLFSGCSENREIILGYHSYLSVFQQQNITHCMPVAEQHFGFVLLLWTGSLTIHYYRSISINL